MSFGTGKNTGNRDREIVVSAAMTNVSPGLDSPRPQHARHAPDDASEAAHAGLARRPHRSTRPLWAAVPAILLVVTAACSPAAAPSPTPPGASGGPTPTTNPSTGPTPTGTPATGGIAHPTGATDIVLRFEESGGFVPVEHNLTYAPSFTLYGDGTVVFRDPYSPGTEGPNGIRLAEPFKVASLGEQGLQALLAEALGRGGLAAAQGPYDGGMLADIPTATFTIDADGTKKQVSVTGLSPDSHPQNVGIVTQLAAFAERLRTFADDVNGEQPFQPAGYRGVLLSADQPVGPVIPWPWPDLTPDDFDGGENDLFLSRELTPAQVQTLGIPGVVGGMTGVSVSHEGKVFTFALRPLLPEEGL